MTSSKNVSKPFPPRETWGAESQYLKIKRSSVRFMKLMRLADSVGCSWQSIAREAIDILLDSRLGQLDQPSPTAKIPKK